MRAPRILAGIAVVAAACVAMLPARASADRPEPWQCASLARNEQVNLALEEIFGSLEEGNPLRMGNARPPEILAPLVAQADERAARWAGDLVLTPDQVDLPSRLSAAEYQAMMAACAEIYDTAVRQAGRSAGGQTQPATQPAASFASFRPEPQTDRWGNDLGMVQVGPGDFAACRKHCMANTKCLAFTLYTPPPFNAGFCWMKAAVGNPTHSPHSISAVR